ncbi:hypothetical protein Sango_1249000 [Sesamum angolense]|uniref:Myb/SANT-like domain-containing protein n=1 Tax=Sesamum angolense TaxID=2727404 RepID=A0AAE1WQN6_9LAMI|nr:hypothetical protein Sango_1249000 [Sesamum angolense]
MEDDEGMFVRCRWEKCAKDSMRVWSTTDEKTLLDCLRDIVRNGWKCDNGVSPGTYESLSGMMGRSGFGWNETTHMIVVSNDVFESYLKVDPKVKTMHFKSFPYYQIWCEVFGKDRATGQHDVDFENASNNVSEERVPVSPEYYVPSPDPTVFADETEFLNSFAFATAHVNVPLSDTERVSSKK